MARRGVQPRAVWKVKVRAPVPVEVEDGAARTHSLDHVTAPEGTVEVPEADAGHHRFIREADNGRSRADRRAARPSRRNVMRAPSREQQQSGYVGSTDPGDAHIPDDAYP